MNTRIKTSITSIRPPSIRREDDKEGLPSRKAGDSKEINKTENPKTIPLLKMVEILNAEANSAKGSYFSGGDVKLKESKTKEPLFSYLKGHKTNLLTIQPQFTFQPCEDWKSWTRELAHLIRPSLYGNTHR